MSVSQSVRTMIPAKSLHPLLTRKILLLIVVGKSYLVLSPVSNVTSISPAGLVLSIISTVISCTLLVLGLAQAGPDKLLQEMGGRLEDLGEKVRGGWSSGNFLNYRGGARPHTGARGAGPGPTSSTSSSSLLSSSLL